MKKLAGWLILWALMGGLTAVANLGPAEEGFSRERALEDLKVLAGTIGPRPLGTPQEKAALKYFADTLAGFGCQVEWQAVTGGTGIRVAGGLNTSSFNVIGRLPGASPREIVIGAHIDSATPEIPGANDDGSGVATIIELARVLAKQPHDSTLVFVAFCGEEAGLIGSRSFVENYPLERIALMLQLDMTSDDAPLLLFVDTKKAQSPPWLVSASVDAFHSLGYRNIVYPVFFQSLNSAIDGAGSDHAPFLEKGIPAIGFVTDISNPIHTPNDSLEYFEPAGLERSGRLVLELVKRFDQGRPPKKVGHYMLVLIGEKPVFVPLGGLKIFILAALAVSAAAFIRLFLRRKANVDWTEDRRVKKSWPKLLVVNIVIVVAMFLSLWTMQRVSGHRTPWYAHPGPYILYAFLFFVLGVWLGLQLTRVWKLRKNAFFYFARASIYLAVLVALAWLASGPRLALFPAAGLLFLSLACLAPWTWLKGLLWILAPFGMLRMLVLSETDAFVFRSAAMAFGAFKTLALTTFFWALLILFFLLWTMPFLLGFAAVSRSAKGDLWAMKGFRRGMGIIPIGILVLAGAVYLRTVPAYDGPWDQEVTVTLKRDTDKKTAAEFSSFGFLRGIQATIGGREVELNERAAFKRVEMPLDLDWLTVKAAPRLEEAGPDTIAYLPLSLEFKKPPYAVSLRLESDRPFQLERANVKVRHRRNRAEIRWAYAPGQSLSPEMDIRLPKGARLEAEITATFLELPVPVSCRGQGIQFVQRAEVKDKVGILGPT